MKKVLPQFEGHVQAEAKSLLFNYQPINWRQENTMKATFKDYSEVDDYSNKKLNKEQKKLNTEIFKSLSSTFKGLIDAWTHEYFYLKEPMPIGDVVGYKNASIDHVSINRSIYLGDHITLHITFEIENPYQQRIDELKEIERKYINKEITLTEDESMKNYEEERWLNPYLSNFSYCFLYDIDFEKLQQLVELIKQPDYIDFATDYLKLIKKRNPYLHRLRMRGRPDNIDLTYQETLEYWDICDLIDDINYRKKVTPKILHQRHLRRTKPEQQYNEENERMKKMLEPIFAELNLKKSEA